MASTADSKILTTETVCSYLTNLKIALLVESLGETMASNPNFIAKEKYSDIFIKVIVLFTPIRLDRRETRILNS